MHALFRTLFLSSLKKNRYNIYRNSQSIVICITMKIGKKIIFWSIFVRTVSKVDSKKSYMYQIYISSFYFLQRLVAQVFNNLEFEKMVKLNIFFMYMIDCQVYYSLSKFIYRAYLADFWQKYKYMWKKCFWNKKKKGKYPRYLHSHIPFVNRTNKCYLRFVTKIYYGYHSGLLQY